MLRRPTLLLLTTVLLGGGLAAWRLVPVQQKEAAAFSLRPSARAPRPTPQLPAPPPPEAEPTPAPPPPRLPPSRELSVSLSEPPALRYLAATAGENDAFYKKLVQQEARGEAVYDVDLGRAAREFVFQCTEFGDTPPSDVREFLIRGAGGVAGDTVFQHVRTSSDAEGALRKAIQSVLAERSGGSGILHIGVGEVYEPGRDLPRHIGVVATRLGIDVDEVGARAEPGDTWTLSGRLRARWTDLEALVMRPDLSIETVPVQVDGDRVRAEIPVGSQAGDVDVQLVGKGPEGPGKLVQLRVAVGRDPPRTYRARLAADEGGLKDADQAAAYAFQLVNADRARFGLPSLQWDQGLAVIARDHSADMRDHDFFGHLSPTTGLHTDRLQKAGWRALASAENLAHNRSIFEAQAGLMASLGHRRNLLDKDVTHLGIGVVGAEENGQRRWWLTQLFGKPVVDLEPRAEAARLRQVLADARSKAGLQPLGMDEGLDAVAQHAADHALQSGIQGASQQALDLAKDRGLLQGRLRASAVLTPDAQALQAPEAALLAEVTRLGLGVAQARGDGRVAVVFLIADW